MGKLEKYLNMPYSLLCIVVSLLYLLMYEKNVALRFIYVDVLSTVLKREVGGADKGIMVMSKYISLVTKHIVLFAKSARK